MIWRYVVGALALVALALGVYSHFQTDRLRAAALTATQRDLATSRREIRERDHELSTLKTVRADYDKQTKDLNATRDRLRALAARRSVCPRSAPSAADLPLPGAAAGAGAEDPGRWDDAPGDDFEQAAVDLTAERDACAVTHNSLIEWINGIRQDPH